MAYLITTTQTPKCRICDLPAFKPSNGKKFSLEELQKAVNGYIEVVTIPMLPNGILIVNEEGLLKDMAYNPLASMIAGQQIVGDVLLMRMTELD